MQEMIEAIIKILSSRTVKTDAEAASKYSQAILKLTELIGTIDFNHKVVKFKILNKSIKENIKILCGKIGKDVGVDNDLRYSLSIFDLGMSINMLNLKEKKDEIFKADDALFKAMSEKPESTDNYGGGGMNVQELIDILKGQPPDKEIILQSDPEGNNYSEISEVDVHCVKVDGFTVYKKSIDPDDYAESVKDYGECIVLSPMF